MTTQPAEMSLTHPVAAHPGSARAKAAEFAIAAAAVPAPRPGRR